jgi:hypothetical protein
VIYFAWMRDKAIHILLTERQSVFSEVAPRIAHKLIILKTSCHVRQNTYIHRNIDILTCHTNQDKTPYNRNRLPITMHLQFYQRLFTKRMLPNRKRVCIGDT